MCLVCVCVCVCVVLTETPVKSELTSSEYRSPVDSYIVSARPIAHIASYAISPYISLSSSMAYSSQIFPFDFDCN